MKSIETRLPDDGLGGILINMQREDGYNIVYRVPNVSATHEAEKDMISTGMSREAARRIIYGSQFDEGDKDE
jgi:hypothetical protein